MAIHHRRNNLDSPLLGDTIFRSNSMGSGSYKKFKNPGGKTSWVLGLLTLFALACVVSIVFPDIAGGHVRQQQQQANPPVLVSYSYFEKDPIQVSPNAAM